MMTMEDAVCRHADAAFARTAREQLMRHAVQLASEGRTLAEIEKIISAAVDTLLRWWEANGRQDIYDQAIALGELAKNSTKH